MTVILNSVLLFIMETVVVIVAVFGVVVSSDDACSVEIVKDVFVDDVVSAIDDVGDDVPPDD